MGFALATLQFLAQEHRREPFCEPLLTLGRQDISATRGEMERMLEREGIPSKLMGEKVEVTDREFFAALGVPDVKALDYSDYEKAEIVHDLNLPISETLRGRFGTIVDGGTLEHVFDVRQGLMNVAEMLVPGGRVIHISPANNWANHGFYQFSPTLYMDYYGVNGFEDLRGFVAAQPIYGFEFAKWDVYELRSGVVRMTGRDGLMNLFVAKKTATSTSDQVPTQAFYEQVYAGKATHQTSRLAQIGKRLPVRVRAGIARRVPEIGPFRKPWGLDRAGKLG